METVHQPGSRRTCVMTLTFSLALSVCWIRCLSIRLLHQHDCNHGQRYVSHDLTLYFFCLSLVAGRFHFLCISLSYSPTPITAFYIAVVPSLHLHLITMSLVTVPFPSYSLCVLSISLGWNKSFCVSLSFGRGVAGFGV